MATCPNKNLQEWKDLVTSQGEEVAYDLWDRYQGEIPSEENYSLDNTYMTEASAETVATVKDVALKMGIKINTLTDYAKDNPNLPTNTLAGVSNLVKGTIGMAHGHENVAITEEVVHIATAILEQTNPELITSIISKIGNYKIYKQVHEQYKGLKAYQTGDGKPNIRKIKKEAADKVITELIVNKLNGSENVPELFQKENRNQVQRLWDTILESIRGLYKQSDVDLFKSAADKIIEGNVGATFSDVASELELRYLGEEEFYQAPQERNEVVDKVVATIKGFHNRMKLTDKTATDKRHYSLDGERIAQSVTEKLSKKEVADVTDKMRWGSAGHKYLEDYITENLIDKEGYIKTFTDKSISTEIPADLQLHIREFAEKLISSYPKGTRFLIEQMAVNEKVKGKLASTIDFMAVIPTKDKKGNDDVKIDVLDWKFTSINKNKNDEDIPWYKQDDWKKQMGEYTTMIQNYGINRNKISKARMIPFVVKYAYEHPGVTNSDLVMDELEVGDPNNLKESKMYLLGVPLDTESTGNSAVDQLLLGLRSQLEKLYSKAVNPTEKHIKFGQLAELRRAIRKLHIQRDFEPLHNIGKTFINNIKKTLKDFEGLDFASLSEEELNGKLLELLEFSKTSEKFINLDKIFESTLEGDKMSSEEAGLYRKLSVIATSTSSLLDQIVEVQKEFAVHIGVKEGFVSEEAKENILAPEREIGNVDKWFADSSKLPSRIINMVSNLVQVAKKTKGVIVNRKITNFGKLLLPLEAEARRQGKKAFDLIGKVEDGTLKLIKKLDPAFIDSIKEAFENEDKTFLIKNMDLKTYNELAEDAVRKTIIDINNTTFSSEEAENLAMRQSRIAQIKRDLLIEELEFTGYNSRFFKFLYYKSLKEEGNYSKEYKNIVKNKAIHDVWQYFTDLNIEAKEMGYLENEGLSFFPLIEATVINKLIQTKGLGNQMKDFFNDNYMVRLQEAPEYGKIDPETGKIIKAIPKYYKSTDKKAEQLSLDLNKVGAMWIDALEEYKTNQKLENIVQTLHAVERNKGVLAVDKNSDSLIFSGGDPMVLDKDTNARILEAIIDDGIYNIREDASSLGNVAIQKTGVGISAAIEKTTGKEETKEDTYNRALSVKKSMRSANTLVIQLALGLKYAVGLANWVGTQMQTAIKSGNFYSFPEYMANNVKVTSGVGLTTMQKGLLNLFVPLNEHMVDESRRKIASKQGLVKWLSTWSFMEVMMSTLQAPERKLQFANGLSFIDNTMVVDGELVNIRQYVKTQDRKEKKGKTFEQRKAIDNTYKERVNELKNTQALDKIARFENDELIIPGVSDQSIGKYRTKIIEYQRSLSGMMDHDNKMGFRRDTLASSFMMFKSWIPKLVSVRAQGLKRNNEIEDWEYGRLRAFVKAYVFQAKFSVGKLHDMAIGNDRGLELINEILEDKKRKHFLKTGQELEITPEEFQELMSSLIRQQMREVLVLLSTAALYLAVKSNEPPEDASPYEKNKSKHLLRAVNKIYDEIWFYYNPISAEAMLQGSFIPAVGLFKKTARFFTQFGIELQGQYTGDLDMVKKAKPTKYFINLFPVGSQFMNELLPLINPELAKDLGIRVTSESRKN